MVREGIREVISRESDMEVIGEAGDGEEALRLVAGLEPDIVLMDIAMPALNGIEATRQIKEKLHSVCILILTAYDNPEFIFAVIEAGAAGYLLKNVKGEELVNAIRATYFGESVLHPAIARKVFAHLPVSDSKPSVQENNVLLTDRELEVVGLAADGMSNKEIAQKLSLGSRTIQTHWRNIFNKLGVGGRTEAIIFCLKNNWLTLEKLRI